MDVNTKLPNNLIEYLNRCKEFFDLAQRVGLIKGLTWEEHSFLLKKEYALMKSMDDQQLKAYLLKRHQANLPVYESFLMQDAKYTGMAKMRQEIGQQANELKRDMNRGK